MSINPMVKVPCQNLAFQKPDSEELLRGKPEILSSRPPLEILLPENQVIGKFVFITWL